MALLPSVRNLRGVLQSVVFVPFAYTFFYNMIPIFLTAWESANRLQDRFQDNFRSRQNMYDYVVVGGGTSGSVVANRLSEFYSVLLLEAGGDSNPLQLVPAFALNYVNYPQTDWSYKTVPQRLACLNSINQQGHMSAGLALGGSSNLDFMAFLRGHPVDFDSWAMILGDRGWSYAQVLPFFRRSEEFIGSTTDNNARGGDGEMRVRQPDFIGLGSEWIRAGEELGYPNVDLNGLYTEGFGILQYPVRRGMRQSTARAFIRPIRVGPRLRVLTHSMVNRILFRDRSNMAYGVEFERFGRTDIAIATKEVIICAGTLQTPKLLMLSGVGPRQHLEQMGIPVRSDLPVGRNLQDHLGVQLGPFYINETKSFLLDRDVTPENIVRWILKGSGSLSTSGLQGAAAFSSSYAKERGEQNWPDIQLLLQGQGVHRDYPQQFARAYGLQEDEMIRYYENAVGRDSFHIRVIGARPTSTGSVTLTSLNPRDPPVINPRYLEDNGQGDFRVLMEGIQMALRLVENTTSFRSVGAEFTRMSLPGCESMEFRSTSYWECYVQRYTMSQHNPVGTCSMGSVVDPDLKVMGTRGLRVISAAIMPTIVSVGTLASTIMIAEKGSDAILRDQGGPQRNRGLADAFFGRNGVINQNPIQKFLSREFDRINPLPALFRTPRNESNNFNPFSRFLGIFNLNRNRNAGGGLIENLFSSLNAQAASLFSILLGGMSRNANGNSNNNNIFSQLFPPLRNQTTSTPPTPTPLSNNNNTLFDIIFPLRNNTITLPNPFQDIFGNNRNRNNNNIFGNMFAPQNNTQTGGLFDNNQNSGRNNNNIFSQLFSPRNNTPLTGGIFGINSQTTGRNNNNNIFGQLFAPRNNTSLGSIFRNNQNPAGVDNRNIFGQLFRTRTVATSTDNSFSSVSGGGKIINNQLAVNNIDNNILRTSSTTTTAVSPATTITTTATASTSPITTTTPLITTVNSPTTTIDSPATTIANAQKAPSAASITGSSTTILPINALSKTSKEISNEINNKISFNSMNPISNSLIGSSNNINRSYRGVNNQKYYWQPPPSPSASVFTTPVVHYHRHVWNGDSSFSSIIDAREHQLEQPELSN